MDRFRRMIGDMGEDRFGDALEDAGLEIAARILFAGDEPVRWARMRDEHERKGYTVIADAFFPGDREHLKAAADLMRTLGAQAFAHQDCGDDDCRIFNPEFITMMAMGVYAIEGMGDLEEVDVG